MGAPVDAHSAGVGGAGGLLVLVPVQLAVLAVISQE